MFKTIFGKIQYYDNNAMILTVNNNGEIYNIQNVNDIICVNENEILIEEI